MFFFGNNSKHVLHFIYENILLTYFLSLLKETYASSLQRLRIGMTKESFMFRLNFHNWMMNRLKF